MWTKDSAGNSGWTNSLGFNFDNTAPTVTFGTNGSSTWLEGHSTTVAVTDNENPSVGFNYYWCTDSSNPSNYYLHWSGIPGQSELEGTGPEGYSSRLGVWLRTK